MRLIGICGKKRHGKDTVAQILKKNYGYGIHHFADPLKEACSLIFGFTDEQLNGADKEAIDGFWKTTPRNIMQVVGTELFRDELPKYVDGIGNDIWLKSFIKRYDDTKRVVIADVRFENEYNWIKSAGGIVIKVQRVSLNDKDMHASENTSLPADFVITNDGTIGDLEVEVERIMAHYSSYTI